MRATTAPRLGFLVKTFPKVSETFILREVLGLERRGLDLHIFSLHNPSDRQAHAAVAEVAAPVTYVPWLRRGGLAAVLVAHLALLLRAPGSYLAAVGFVLRRPEGNRWREFVQAGCLVPRLRAAGVAHLHAHFISEPAGVAELVHLLTGIPFSISAHAKDIYLSTPEVLRRKLTRARFTTTCTEYNRRHLAAIAGADGHVVRTYHGLEIAALTAERTPPPALRPQPVDPDGRPLILSVGRLRPKKGFPALLHACRELRDAGHSLRCEIVGYGPQQAELEGLIDALDLGDTVQLVGKLTHETLLDRYRAATLFVLPCEVAADGDRDGIPNVLLEAMALGVPVVTTDVSGIPELVVDGRNGRCLPAGDPAALSAAIGELVRDAPQRARLAAAGRATVAERFDTEHNLAPLAALLREAVADGAARIGAAEPRATRGEVAYILKGFPRLSETFIAHEIHLLEEMGLALRLFSVKHGDSDQIHGVVKQIRAPLTTLPATTSLSASRLLPWLVRNLPPFAAAHGRLLRRRPLAYLGALVAAVAMGWRYRKGPWQFRKVFLKEFLQAGYIAEAILAIGTVRHLHGHFCHGATTITLLASRLTGLPFSFTAHAKDIYQTSLNPGDLLQRKLRAARFVATCTGANEHHLQELCPESRVVHKIYHGLDTTLFRPDSTVAHGAIPEILAVGRLVAKKGFPTLVEACARLRDRGVEVRCRIVGEEGDDSTAVAERIATLGLSDRITVQSAVTQEELIDRYHRATLFALPCQVVADGDRDGIPNVLVEAMAMGLPVVSTPVSGIPELVADGVNGLLVAPGDADALADAIEGLLGDAHRRRSLGLQARRTVCERFDAAQTTQELKRLFLVAMGEETVATPSETTVARVAA